MMIKLLIGKWIVPIVLTFGSQQGLAEDVKDKFYKDLIPILKTLEKMSWSYSVVTSTYMLGRMQVIMMVLGMVAEI